MLIFFFALNFHVMYVPYLIVKKLIFALSCRSHKKYLNPDHGMLFICFKHLCTNLPCVRDQLTFVYAANFPKVV